MAAGVSSDHEITSADDFLEKLRAGMTVELRGSHDYLLPDVVKALNQLPQVPSTLTVCTDDVPPDYLVERGGLCDLLRRLIAYGLDPVQAIRCATLNGSYRLRRPDLGLLAAGRVADIAVLRDLREMNVVTTIVDGSPVARDGRMIAPFDEPKVETPIFHRLPLHLLEADDFRLPISGTTSGRARVRVIKGVRFTEWGESEVEVRDGFVQVPSGYSLMFVQHRHGKHEPTPQRALLADWGDMKGAIATTYSHDSHNLVVLGGTVEDMKVAANALIECGGGMAVARAGRVLARIEMPIAGLLATGDPQAVAKAFHAVREAAGEVVDWKPPYRVFKAIEGTCLACNPGPHLTDLGLTDGTTGEIVSGTVARE
jgi:adenine deaminase